MLRIHETMYEIILDVFAYMMRFCPCVFFFPRKRKRREVTWCSDFVSNSPQASRRLLPPIQSPPIWRLGVDSGILIQIYLGYKRKTVYKKFFGVKKICIAGDAKVLKWRIPIFQTFSGRTDCLVRNVFKIYSLLHSRFHCRHATLLPRRRAERCVTILKTAV